MLGSNVLTSCKFHLPVFNDDINKDKDNNGIHGDSNYKDDNIKVTMNDDGKNNDDDAGNTLMVIMITIILIMVYG